MITVKIPIFQHQNTEVPCMERSCKFCPKLFTVLSVPVFILLYSFTALIVLVVIALASLNMRRAVRFMIRFWARASFVVMMKRLNVVGREHIDKERRYILVANHSSLFDILAVMAFYPGVSWFGKEYLSKIPVFGKVLRMIDFVPMRSTGIHNTKSMLGQLLQNSKSSTVAIFPEGTRTRDGELNRFRKGFVHLIRATDHQVLPVTLKGFFHLKPANRFYINFSTKLRVVIHPPMSNEVLQQKNDNEIVDTVRDVIESAIIA